MNKLQLCAKRLSTINFANKNHDIKIKGLEVYPSNRQKVIKTFISLAQDYINNHWNDFCQIMAKSLNNAKDLKYFIKNYSISPKRGQPWVVTLEDENGHDTTDGVGFWMTTKNKTEPVDKDSTYETMIQSHIEISLMDCVIDYIKKKYPECLKFTTRMESTDCYPSLGSLCILVDFTRDNQ